VEERGRGRLKKWLNRIECDMRTAGVCMNYVDRVMWRLRAKMANPK